METSMSGAKSTKRSSSLPALSQSIEWMGIALAIPEDWQIVRHSLSLDRGGLTIVDRRVQRLQLIWKSVAQEPDVERMIEHEREEQEKAGGSEVRALQGFGRWRVLRSVAEGKITTRAARFDPKTSRLVEAVISTTEREHRGNELVSGLLGAIRVVCRAEAARHWSAFDIAITTPPDFRLMGSTVNPADVSLRFEAVDPEDGRSLGAEVSVHRRGMVRDWYAGNAEALIRRDLPKVSFESFAPTDVFGHAATEAVGREPAPPLRRVLGRQRELQALLWRCEPENALYLVTTTSPPTHKLSPRDFDVDCCARKRHEKA